MTAGRVACGLLVACALGHGQERCGAARDMVVRALERLTGAGGNSEVEDALQLVKQAAGECADLGDAWYYRSLFEAKLGHKQLADYALGKAKLLGSEGLNEGADPFHLAAPPGQAPSQTIHDKYALVIGVGKFQSRYVPPLRYTAKDARDFAAVLGDAKLGRFASGHVHVLTDREATTVAVKAELNWLARTAGPDDLAVIYISSHGSARELDTAGANYIVTYDTDVSDADRLYATALPMIEVAEVVRTRARARRTAVFLDTCHSAGALANLHAASASPAMMSRMERGTGRAIITSSQVAEKSWESEKLGNGYFTYFLMQAIKQSGGMAPVDKLYEFVKARVSESVRADVHQSQTPAMERSDDVAGQMVIGAAAAPVAGLLRYPWRRDSIFNAPCALPRSCEVAERRSGSAGNQR